MKALRFLLAAAVVLSSAPAWAAVRIAALAGTVEFQSADGGSWSPATVGMEIPEGASLRTTGDGRAELAYPDKGKVWLKENSQVKVETQSGLLDRLSMTFGSIKARFPRLSRNRRVEFKTSTAVAAIRGTEIIINQTPDGKYDLNVLFGKVELRLSGVPKPTEVMQGQGFGVGGAGQRGNQRLLNKIEEVRGQEDWGPGLSQEQRVKGLEMKEQNRDEMKNFARQDESRRDRISQAIGASKEADLEAGRTLTDIHGNLVRVDQRLLRPSANEFQIVNLIKRPVYNYNAPGANGVKWAYYGAASIPNRLDAMQLRMAFPNGTSLPDQVTAWPQFFGDHEPQRVEQIFSNQTNGSDIVAVAFAGNRDPVTGNLESDLYVAKQISCGGSGGTGTNAQQCLAALRDFKNQNIQIDPNDATVGTTGCSAAAPCYERFVDPASGQAAEDHTPDDSLVEVGADRFVKNDLTTGGSAQGTEIWLARELYIINNDGGIRKTADFTDSDSDPFTIMKETAVQMIFYVKTNAASNSLGCTGGKCVNNGAGGDYLQGGRNIDLVVTPDLVVALAQKVLTELDSLNTD